MIKTHSTSSFGALDDPLTDTNTILINLTDLLISASKSLSNEAFNNLLNTTIKTCIKKAQLQNIPQNYLIFIKKWSNLFNINIQLIVRILILEIHCYLIDNNPEILSLINKTKFIILNTNIQYLFMKILLLEFKYYLCQQDQQKAQKCLKKSIEYSQNYAIQFLKQSQDVRKQILDIIIIIHFQMYKLKKDKHLQLSIQYLTKSYNVAIKNYGLQNLITQNLLKILNFNNTKKYQQKNNIDSAISIIIDKIYKKINKKIYTIYNWQQQKIIIQLLDLKNQKIIYQLQYQCLLDYKKIQILRKINWLEIKDNQIQIVQNQFYKIIGKKKNSDYVFIDIDPQDIIKKSNVSQDSEDIQPQQLQGFLVSHLPKIKKTKRKESF